MMTPTPVSIPNCSSVTGNASSNAMEMGDDDSEDESEILEESPCGRWLKRREEVEQRDIPGIDATFLAMDTEEGVEVVWNEVQFSERKYFNSKEENICEVFDRLILLNHPNIVKLHKYWMDKDVEKPRVIFITEYMSSGSLKLFLKKTKKNDVKMSLGAWKRWCTQILSALCYLHSARPAIVHENLTCDTIFISHNGLIKIGAVAPNAIHQHIKTVADDTMSNIYLVAPEIANMTGDIGEVLTPAVDIYSFGMCALEMAALEITGNGETSQITSESIEKTIESLDNELQKDFIRQCILDVPAQRPTAKQLLFHPVIFEVPSLTLCSAHALLNNNQTYQLTDETLQKSYHKLPPETVLSEIVHADGRVSVLRRVCDMPRNELEKFFDEVRNGAYPLTAIIPTTKPPIISRQRTISPVQSGDRTDKPSTAPENPYNEENRKIVNMMCNIKAQQENENLMMLTLLLRLDDKMNRQLSCEITDIESPICLANELVYYGFINQVSTGQRITLAEVQSTHLIYSFLFRLHFRLIEIWSPL
jgi:nuclear receptor-binding protein